MIISSDNPRAIDPRMAEAIQVEVKDLLSRVTFKIMHREKILDGAYILTGSYMLAIRSKADVSVKFKCDMLLMDTKMSSSTTSYMAHIPCGRNLFAL